jgi:hypothetical protein
MAASLRSKLSPKPEMPIQSGASIARQCCGRAFFACGDGLVQQVPDFLAGDVARPARVAPSAAHLLCLCGEEFAFQGVKQRR